MKIPVCKPDITSEDVEAVRECVESGWVSGISPWVERFEKAFAEYVGAKYAVATNSGTTALHLALASLGVKRGWEVVIPDFTMIATANAVRYCGAQLKFVDCEADTWNINPDLIRPTKKTKVVLPAHIYGHPAYMDPIVRLAEVYGWKIVDDAAEALGAEYCGHKVGGFTDASCFSFYANKIITTGDGGAVTTSDKSLYERMQWLKAHAFGRNKHFWHERLGFSYRMSGLQAALGLSQLKRVDKYVEARREHARMYMDVLKPLADNFEIMFPVEKRYAKNVYWMFTVLLKTVPRNHVMAKLAAKGIETRPAFTPMHQQPIYKKLVKYPRPNSEYVGRVGINLPSSNGLTEQEIHYVCEALKECLA